MPGLKLKLLNNIKSLFLKSDKEHDLQHKGTSSIDDLREGAFDTYTLKRPPKRLRKKSPQGENNRQGFNFENTNLKLHDERTEGSGRRCVDVGDIIANELRGEALDIVYMKVAIWLKHLGIKTSSQELQDRYAGKNTGIQRMCLGNLIRGALKDPKNKGVELPSFKMI